MTLAATLTVDTEVDETDGSCTDGDCSLRDAILLAAPGDEIVVGPVSGGTIAIVSDLPDVEVDLSITTDAANPTTIDGQNMRRMFRIMSGVTVDISNLVLKNGRTGSNGGCVANSGDLTLDNMTFKDCYSGGNGGAIFSFIGGSTLSLKNSLIRSCEAYYSGGGLGTQAESTTIENTVILENSSSGAGGGLSFNGGYNYILNSEISDNICVTDGGGIYSTGSDVTVTNTTISGNAASENGGGVYATSGGPQNFNFVTIADNSADFNNDGVGDGGGIFANNPGRVTLKNSIISDNTDVSTAGDTHPDISGEVNYLGQVLVSDTTGATLDDGGGGTLLAGNSAQLYPLEDYSGTTRVHALEPYSPAIARVDDFTPIGGGEEITEDQRYGYRPQGGGLAEIGAFESMLPGGVFLPQYTGWWWQGPDYSGTGISIEDQGDYIYLAWYGYDDTGWPVWYSALTRRSGSGFAGDLVRYMGWPLSGDTPGDGYQGVIMGPLKISFSDTENAVLTYSIGETDYSKSLVRFWDGELDARSIHGWWYDPAYEGMGVFLEARDGQIFGSWYHYRDDTNPRWWITLGAFGSEDTTYSGQLGEYSSGQTITGDYQPAVLESAEMGPVDIEFGSDTEAIMDWQGHTYHLERFIFVQ